MDHSQINELLNLDALTDPSFSVIIGGKTHKSSIISVSDLIRLKQFEEELITKKTEEADRIIETMTFIFPTLPRERIKKMPIPKLAAVYNAFQDWQIRAWLTSAADLENFQAAGEAKN